MANRGPEPWKSLAARKIHLYRLAHACLFALLLAFLANSHTIVVVISHQCYISGTGMWGLTLWGKPNTEDAWRKWGGMLGTMKGTESPSTIETSLSNASGAT